MNRRNFIFFNNRWTVLEKAAISPLDHGFLYGDGIFETIRVYQGRPFQLKEHLERLFQSGRRIGLSLPKSSKEIHSIIDKTLFKNNISEGMIRITCSRGPGAVGQDPSLCSRPTFIVMTFPFSPPPSSLYLKGISLGIVKTVRNHPGAVPNEIKSANFLNNILGKLEAKQMGADEGIFLNYRGYVAEGTISNIFHFRKKILITPPPKAGILEGVTRNTVIKIAKKCGRPVREKLYKAKELFSADECFITSTGYEIMPATQLNGKKIGSGKPGPLTKELMELFIESVKHSL